MTEIWAILDELGWLFVLPEASMRNKQYYESPVRDVVDKAEPQAAHLEGFSISTGGQQEHHTASHSHEVTE